MELPFLFLLLVLIIGVSYLGYMAFRWYAEKQARTKKRNQYHDRV